MVSFANYGTILHIDSVESMEDGRFFISTKGERRFKVLEQAITDGYHTAQIIFLFDERVTNRDEIGKYNLGVLGMTNCHISLL